jgi:hypothetical protein
VRASRVSRHVREGALSQIDAGVETSDKEIHDPAQALSGTDVPPDSFNDWKQTMEGMLDGERIEEDLHRELGIPVTCMGALPAVDHASASLAQKPRSLIVEGGQLDDGRGLKQNSEISPQSGIAIGDNGSTPTAPDGSVPRASHSDTPPPETMRISDSHSIPRRSSSHQPSPPGINAVSPPPGPQGNPSQLPLPIAAPASLPKEAEDPELYGKMLATELYHEDETHIHKEDVAEYLGGVYVTIFESASLGVQRLIAFAPLEQKTVRQVRG